MPLKRWPLFASVAALVALLAAGCATLDERQREWIFQPSDSSWGNTAAEAVGMQDVWISFDSPTSGEPVHLHGLWLPADRPDARSDDRSNDRHQAPVLLLLHGARYNVAGSAPRIRRMQELGFSVLAIDYRGFGKSSPALPSEDTAREDARAAWDWLARKYPDRPRYIYGHSLGGAIGIDLAAQVHDERGVIVESTFTSIADVASSFKWGWLPFKPFITQRFAAIEQVKHITAPLLVVHGTADHLINPTLGRRLYDAATVPKMFVLVQGGSHHDTNALGEGQYREALAALFHIEDEDAQAAHDRAQEKGAFGRVGGAAGPGAAVTPVTPRRVTAHLDSAPG